jgi:hypothetical protein
LGEDIVADGMLYNCSHLVRHHIHENTLNVPCNHGPNIISSDIQQHF